MTKIRHRMFTSCVLGCIILTGCQVSNTGASHADGATPAPKVQAAPASLAGDAPATAQCKLDLVSGARAVADMSVAHGSGAAFEGWAFAKGKPPLRSVYLVFNGADGRRFVVPVQTGIQRDDVAQGFSDASLATSGFAVTANISELPAGRYMLGLRTGAPDDAASCDLAARIEVTN
jgi:hypothetical protein